jgi:hypothetical protein
MALVSGSLPEKLQVLVELDVRLVAHPHVVGKPPQALDFGLGDERQGHVAGLGEQGDVALGGLPQPHQVEVFLEVEHPRGVRPDQADAVAARDGHHRRLQFAAGLAGFAEPAGDDDRTLDPLLAAFLQHGRDGAPRGGDQGDVHRALDVGDLGVAVQPEDRALLGVDGVDRAFELLVEQGANGLEASFGFVARRADDGDRIGVENGVKRHVVLPEGIWGWMSSGRTQRRNWPFVRNCHFLMTR